MTAQSSSWWISYFLVVGLVCQYYFIFKSLGSLRVELLKMKPSLETTQLSIQELEAKSVEPMQKLQQLLQRVEVVEKRSVENEKKLNEFKNSVAEMVKKLNTSIVNNTKPGIAVAGQPANATTPSLTMSATIDHEKLETFLSINVPAEVRNYYAYSQSEAATLDTLEGDNANLISYVKKYKVIPPPAAELRVTYAVNETAADALRLKYIFQNKSGGYFVECGAYDGLTSSKTIFLESSLKWSGALIEADPQNFRLALAKQRNAALLPTCLSLTTKPKLSAFKAGLGEASKVDASNNETFKVHCMPLQTIILALNQKTVDFLRLSIGGSEAEVLKSIPFDKVDIKVLLVNYQYVQGGKKTVEDILVGKGYVSFPSTAPEQEKGQWAENNQIFVKKGSGYKEA
ncbi:uncharacterized protein LOC132193414 [Neocloeon triangulifer]|uniref:uncharacterized protein LOC132193414 n=1 Tax=Neocloeon triangulifer TaxID=2078957 RepID=UPI00286EBD4C|nr:uncharacterized protein LOC132193414 [Neocloeon triangulifer]